MMRFSELELKEKEGCVSSAAPGLGRERELAESQCGAGDWELSQPSSRPSAALSALSDHTEQHNGKTCARNPSRTVSLSSAPFFLSLLAITFRLSCNVCCMRCL